MQIVKNVRIYWEIISKYNSSMFIFNLSITLVIAAVLGYLTYKLSSKVNLDNRNEEILLSWFMALALIIVIRCIANVGLHYDISHQVGSGGRVGLGGSQGFRGQDSECN